MAQATRNGAIIMPPVPAFYALPSTLDDVVTQTVARALELLDISVPDVKRWDGRSAASSISRGSRWG
jgi:4-hydroxy-3-polyprenylbenzoate decarboxylase